MRNNPTGFRGSDGLSSEVFSGDSLDRDSSSSELLDSSGKSVGMVTSQSGDSEGIETEELDELILDICGDVDWGRWWWSSLFSIGGNKSLAASSVESGLLSDSWGNSWRKSSGELSLGVGDLDRGLRGDECRSGGRRGSGFSLLWDSMRSLNFLHEIRSDGLRF